MMIALEKDRSSEEKLSFWTSLLIAMIQSEGYANIPFGKALQQAGWSETRLNQLLHAGPDSILTELRRLGQYLKSKNQKADWNQAKSLAWAVCFGTEQQIKTARLRIARSYFTSSDKEDDA